jgi:hypothetical protein
VLLTGVPPVHFFQGGPRCPEDITFPSCMRAALEYLGDNLGCRHLPTVSPGWGLNCAYAYLMGVTGYAFGLAWREGWDPGNNDIRWIGDDPAAPFRRALAAAGYGGEVLLKGQGQDDEALYRAKIIASLQAGRPAIAVGVVGPPECCLVTGYDQGGDLLMGRSFFQEMPEHAPNQGVEPTGEFRQGDWFAQTEGLILLGDRSASSARGPIPNRHQVYRRALADAVALIRTPDANGRHTGLAAYDAWAEHLLRDAEFATEELLALNERFMVHDFAVSAVAEARWYGSLFLSQAANDEPWMGAELLRAAACMTEEHALMWEVWRLVGGIGWEEDKVRKLAEPGVRRAIVEVIRASRERCAQMAAHIEAALVHAERDPV